MINVLDHLDERYLAYSKPANGTIGVLDEV